MTNCYDVEICDSPVSPWAFCCGQPTATWQIRTWQAWFNACLAHDGGSDDR